MPFKIVLWLVVFACLVVPTRASGQNNERDRDGNGRPSNTHSGPSIPWSTPTWVGPPNVFASGFIPVCYARLDGEPRLVRPWSLSRSPSEVCRPPAPWDAVNIPPGGWPNTVCTAGGAFDCRRDEYYTELQTT